ncbi:hypothetical protein [Pseudomonas mangrovi]|uniref:hypothetical protein n=1 Tax=Pseudomonas mangrovi TaxID=2161748 RepID=UPI001F3CC426|nr:hypothetical protein [Pseudomonas mangrovi]
MTRGKQQLNLRKHHAVGGEFMLKLFGGSGDVVEARQHEQAGKTRIGRRGRSGFFDSGHFFFPDLPANQSELPADRAEGTEIELLAQYVKRQGAMV